MLPMPSLGLILISITSSSERTLLQPAGTSTPLCNAVQSKHSLMNVTDGGDISAAVIVAVSFSIASRMSLSRFNNHVEITGRTRNIEIELFCSLNVAAERE